MDVKPSVETRINIKVIVPEESHERQVLNYLDSLTVSLSEALRKLNLISASHYKPVVYIHHQTIASEFAQCSVTGNHMVVDGAGTAHISAGSVNREVPSAKGTTWFNNQPSRSSVETYSVLSDGSQGKHLQVKICYLKSVKK